VYRLVTITAPETDEQTDRRQHRANSRPYSVRYDRPMKRRHQITLILKYTKRSRMVSTDGLNYPCQKCK